jgi:hypothetical protein
MSMSVSVAALAWSLALFGQGGPGGHALRVVPPEMDVSATIRTIHSEGLPVELLVIDVCRSGQALFPPPEGSPFVARSGFESGAQLREWIDEAHKAGLRVYAGMDLLRWVDPLSSDPNLLEARPGLVEMDVGAMCNPRAAAGGGFASPWSGEVRDALRGLLTKLATDYPDLDGLYVAWSLSLDTYMGFSDAARAASILAVGVDPVDFASWGPVDSEPAPVTAWIEWRLSSFREILGEIREAFRTASGGKPMLARAICGVGTWKPRYRAASCQDWLEWRFHSVVDDLVLEIDLLRGVNTPINEFRAGYRLYESIKPLGQPYLLVPGELQGKRVSLPEAAERMDKWPLPQLPLFVDPSQADQLESALALLGALRDNER